MTRNLPSRSDGFVLRVGNPDHNSRDALKIAERIVAEELPRQWVVRRMGRESRDFSVRRPQGQKNPTVAQAFDFSYRLRKHRDVEDCEPILMVSLDGPPQMRPPKRVVRAGSSSHASSSGSSTDHLLCSTSPTWIHELCSIEAAWSLPRPPGGKSHGEGILVGHPDTGFTDHPQFNEPGRLLTDRGFDFEEGDPDARDRLSGFSAGHGTATGSVIMSSVDLEVTGVAPRCKLIPLRVTTSVVLASFGTLAESIRFAADQGHHVLSISLGGPISSRYLRRAVEHAVSRGVIIVCAAGNVWPFVVYPARLDEVIAAAACNCSRSTWSDSASGATVDITAPGESVWRALAEPHNFDLGRSSGTSFSTAIVAGAAALWLAHHGRDNLISQYGPAGVVSVFKELLMTRGFDRPAGWNTANFGVGILNAVKLLSAPLPQTVSAAGMSAVRASAAPRSTNQVDEILELFPHENSVRVRAGLARFLNVSERDLNTALRDVADEIAYLVTTDMDFRRQISQSGHVGAASHRASSKGIKQTSVRKQTTSIPMSRLLKRMSSSQVPTAKPRPDRRAGRRQSRSSIQVPVSDRDS